MSELSYPHSPEILSQPTAATTLPPFSALVPVSTAAPATSKLLPLEPTSSLASALASEAMLLRVGDLTPFVAAGTSGGGCTSASDLTSGMVLDGASGGGFDSSRM